MVERRSRTYRRLVRAIEMPMRPTGLPWAPVVSPRTLLSFGLAPIIVFMVLAATGAAGQATLWENAHWTAAGILATVLAVTSIPRTTGTERRVRQLMAVSTGSWLIGQLLWNLQTSLNAVAVPAPSDAGFLLSAPPAMAAIAYAVKDRIVGASRRAVFLDGAATFVVLTAVIVALFGDGLADLGDLVIATSLAYPIVHLAAAGAGVVALIAARLAPRPRGAYLVLAGFAILGLAWVEWLRQAVLAIPAPGSAASFVFSIGIVTVGLGGATWRVRAAEDPADDLDERAVDAVLAAIPLLALAPSALLIGLHEANGSTGHLDVVAAMVVIGIAGVRQTLLVFDHRRILASERQAHDLHRQALAERALAESRYRTLVEQVPAAVYLDMADDSVTDGGRLGYLSPQIETILGYRPDEFIADPELWPSLIHADDREAALEAYRQHWLTGRPLRTEYRMVARDGAVLWLRDEAYAIDAHPDGPGRVSQGLLTDTTDQKRLEARLVHDANHDPLTGLANRVLFRERVQKAIGRHRRRRTTVAVLFLDLDDFKLVNDTLGHSAGDRLLIEVGRRLAEATRAGDMAARLGGDEFTVLVERVEGTADAFAVADRLAESLAVPVELDGRSFVIGASIGIAVADRTATDVDDLLACADIAMYAAKAAGKGRHVLFDPQMRDMAWSRLEMEAELRTAIDAEAFVLQYQPIVDLAGGQTVGLEALVRWPHPVRGLIAPAEFIPVAEACGLIVPLGRMVLRQACRELAAWRATLPGAANLTISVNLSPREASEADLVRGIAQVLAETGLPAEALVLEITETLLLGEGPSVASNLEALRRLGVGVVVDDFGTGFSALEYFKRFAIGGLKIDRSFVAGLGTSDEDRAIVTATLAFATALGLSVTAEGVETEDQRLALAALGCRLGQGYLFSRPVAADLVGSVLASRADGSMTSGGPETSQAA